MDFGGVLSKQILLEAVGNIGGRYTQGLLMDTTWPFWKITLGALMASRTS